jgi:hypothetical protein
MRKTTKGILAAITRPPLGEKCFGGCGKDMPGPADICDDCNGWNDKE